MKRTLLTLLTLGFIATASYAQTVVNGCIVRMKEAYSPDSLKFKDETLKIAFYPTEHFWKTYIYNTSNEQLTINWEKSTFTLNGHSSRILTNMGQEEMEITGGGKISYDVFPRTLSEAGMLPTISKRFVKKDYEETGKPHTVRITLAFKINGEDKMYDFNFEMIPKPKKAN